jgi:hypothetical protein
MPGTISNDSAAEVITFGLIGAIGNVVASDVTGGDTIYSGFYAQRAITQIGYTTDELVAAYPISTNIAGTTSDEFILVANSIAQSGSASRIYAFLEWMTFM